MQGETPTECKLAVISSHIQPTSPDDPLACEKSPLTGLLKTMALELPWLRCRHIDLEPHEEACDWVLRELSLDKGEPEVAYRQGQRLTPALEQMPMGQPTRQESPIQPGGVYLLVGGLGGIGRHLADWLMTAFAAKLIIIGRTALPDRESGSGEPSADSRANIRLQHYAALAATGGEFVYEATDVCDLETLQRIVTEAESCWQTPLTGIIHLAGEERLSRHWAEMDQRGVVVETPRTFEDVFRAKVYGTWTLYQLLKTRPQASFISFSSVHSIFGAATFGAYAAANSFLDTYTVYQRHHGYPSSYSINWSMWDDIGMSHDSPETAREASRAMGYSLLSKEQGLNAFIAGLWCDQPQLVVGLDGSSRHIRRHLKTADIQTQEWCAYITSDSSGAIDHLLAIELYDDFGTLSHCDRVGLRAMPRTPSGEIDRLALRTMGRQTLAPITERRAPQTDLERTIAAIWAEALQTEIVSTSDNFFELGGHSILLAQVHGKLRTALDKELSIVDLFRYPTINALATYLSQIEDDKPSFETFQDRAAKQRAALQRQRPFRGHR